MKIFVLILLAVISCQKLTDDDLKYIEYVETHGYVLPTEDTSEFWMEEVKKLSKEANKPGYWAETVEQ